MSEAQPQINRPNDELRSFVSRYRDAGLAAEFSEILQSKFADAIPTSGDEVAKRIDILEKYYGGSDDRESSSRRSRMDRFYIHKVSDQRYASEILSGLNDLVPEIPDVRLEKLEGTGGMLVLRAGDEISAIQDDLHSASSTDISVASIVNAINLLMNRFEIRDRFLQLRTDGEREAFFATGVSEGILLCNAGFLEDGSIEELMEFGSW